LLSVPPYNLRHRFEPDTHAPALVDIGAFVGNAPDNIFSGQYRSHRLPIARSFAGHAIMGVNFCRLQACNVRRVIPEIDIWRAATLMLKRYGDKALTRIDELTSDGDHDGADTWRRITTAVERLASTKPPGPLH
jgi:hypothetical protein